MSKPSKVVLSLLLLSLGMTFLPLTWAEDGPPKHTMMVQGASVVTVQPDAVRIHVGVETQNKSLEKTREQNAEKTSQIIQRLKALKIPHLILQTTAYSLYPNHPVGQETGNPNEIIGYTAHNEISVKVENADPDTLGRDAGRMIDTALAAGGTSISGPDFYVSSKNPGQSEALTLAVENARQHAEAIAKGAGVKIIGIYNIDSFGGAVPFRHPMGPMMSAKAANIATPIEPGQYEITANVHVRYLFEGTSQK